MDFDLKDLTKPFPSNRVEWRAGSTNQDKTKALALAYIDSRAVMERLDEVVGPQNWTDDYRSGPDGGVLCGIAININGAWVWKWDGAENSDFEAVKGGLSDAFKRAAVKWGIGRYLYDIPAVWVECEQRGKTVVLKNKPQLPNWALPSNGKAPKAEHVQAEQPDSPERVTDVKLAEAKKTLSPKGKLLNEMTTDQLRQMVAMVDTVRAEGKVVDETADRAYEAAKLIIAHRTA